MIKWRENQMNHCYCFPFEVISHALRLLYALVRHAGYDLSSLIALTQHKKASNHHANLPLEKYSFTL